MDRNQISDNGAKEWARFLKDNKVLGRLDLLRNGIGDKGAKGLAMSKNTGYSRSWL